MSSHIPPAHPRRDRIDIGNQGRPWWARALRWLLVGPLNLVLWITGWDRG
jgi:hypothetical protein